MTKPKKRDKMEVYNQCPTCGVWDDLFQWHELIRVCTRCAPKLDAIQRQHHLSNVASVHKLKEYMRGAIEDW